MIHIAQSIDCTVNNVILRMRNNQSKIGRQYKWTLYSNF